MMRERILQDLERIEREQGVSVLYAVESGSRAWGFASDDSDWDCRFVYIHSREWYLSIEDRREVIEEMLPGDLDLSGWELRKALRLFRKSNPPLMEWLRSPIVYRENDEVMRAWRALVPQYCSPERAFWHYLHMAAGNFRDYLVGEEVWLKKYLYVLRPLLACRYIERHEAWVPMEFAAVVNATVDDPELASEIQRLVERKMAGEELRKGRRSEVIDAFIRSELERLPTVVPKEESRPPIEPLNEFFRWCLDATSR
jgi:predicted nucleotidyltransferase